MDASKIESSRDLKIVADADANDNTRVWDGKLAQAGQEFVAYQWALERYQIRSVAV